jgi:hypothetical protein
MKDLTVGSIVQYKGKEYYLYSIEKGDIRTIVRIRDGDIYNYKGGEKRLNASIVNLPIKELL